ncbi:MAG: polysaccharide deacetylase family protein [Planctomycetaceae bacterium]|nr:polysaccharide deacetylase family protein [Planctomycetaceae bacterium]
MPFLARQVDFRRRTPRFYARHLALDTLSLLSRRQRLQLAHTPRVQLLCLHHIFEDEEDSFRKLLNYLTQQYQVVSYSTAVDAIRNSQINAPTLALSFDDGFTCCLRAVRILKEFGLSACFFLPPAILDCQNDADKIRFCQDRLKIAPVDLMGRDEILQLLDQGMEIGYHTQTHPRVSDLLAEHFQQEFEEGRATLESLVGKVNHFAWPFGQFADFSREAYEYLASQSYASIASAERGCHRSGWSGAQTPLLYRDPIEAHWPIRHIEYFLLRNVTQPELSPEQFARSLPVRGEETT